MIGGDERKFCFQYCEKLRDYYVDIFKLPANSTRRLIELKLAQLEAETRLLLPTLNQPNQLSAELEDKQVRFMELTVKMNKLHKERLSLEKDMLSHKREFEFLKSKLKLFDINKLNQCYRARAVFKRDLQSRQAQADRLHRELLEFDGIEPTNEALEQKTEELRKRRQSLDITFVDLP